MTNTDRKCSCLTPCSYEVVGYMPDCGVATTTTIGISPNATVEYISPLNTTVTGSSASIIYKDSRIKGVVDFTKYPAPAISEISFKGSKTIVKFTDGTTEKAVCKPGETFEKEIGVLICIAKRMTKGNILSIVQKAIRDQENRDAKAAMERQCKKEEAERLAKKRAKLKAKKAKRRAAFELLVEQEKAKLKNQKRLRESESKEW